MATVAFKLRTRSMFHIGLEQQLVRNYNCLPLIVVPFLAKLLLLLSQMQSMRFSTSSSLAEMESLLKIYEGR
jgi:hypothetical protein